MQQAIRVTKHTGTEGLPQIQPDSHFPDSFLPDSFLPDSHFLDSHFPDSFLPGSLFPDLHFPGPVFPAPIMYTNSQDGKTQVFPFFLYNLQERQSFFVTAIVRGDI